MISKLLTAAAIAAPLAIAAPAIAQVATADLNAAVEQSAAMKGAVTQIQAQYKTQIATANARQTALQAELQPLAKELQTLQANPSTPPATLQAKAAAFQQRREAAARELQPLTAPFQRPSEYAQEQVADKLDAAVRAAMQAKNVVVLVRPDAVMAVQPSADLTQDIVAQLNNTVKTVSITPPAGWEPGQQRQAAAAPAAAPARTSGTAPKAGTGR